jgi:hypothetical protein
MPINTVSLYRYRPGQDVDSGATADESTLIAAGVQCSVQQTDAVSEVVNKRARETVMYDVLFWTDYDLRIKDLIVWIDSAGVARDLFVAGQLDQAGRAACWKVKAKEVR